MEEILNIRAKIDRVSLRMLSMKRLQAGVYEPPKIICLSAYLIHGHIR